MKADNFTIFVNSVVPARSLENRDEISAVRYPSSVKKHVPSKTITSLQEGEGDLEDVIIKRVIRKES
jgi:hypothetical protein